MGRGRAEKEVKRSADFRGCGYRPVLGTQMHTVVLHAMIQTGLTGTIKVLGAKLGSWFPLLKALRRLNRLVAADKALIIQAAGVLTFLTVRTLPDSTEAFFGVDWLLLGALLLYLRVVASASATVGPER